MTVLKDVLVENGISFNCKLKTFSEVVKFLMFQTHNGCEIDGDGKVLAMCEHGLSRLHILWSLSIQSRVAN